MPISKTDSLFQLIQSLTKAEKRNFKLYAKRNNSSDSLKFIDLFDIVSKQKKVDDVSILKALKGINKAHYANLKRHLYSQIIISLRLIHKTKRANIQVREYIDYAYILYGKGLYLQAIKLLGIARREAQKHHLYYAHLTIVEFEKVIETRHITRSGEKRAQELITEAKAVNKTISATVYLSNLRVELHGHYLKNGHNKKVENQALLKERFYKKLSTVDENTLGTIERIYLYQAYVWYYYIQLDFGSCFIWATKWVQLFSEQPEMIKKDVDLFMRGYHYILSSSFHLKDVENLEKYLTEFKNYREKNYKKLNTNSQIISFLYVHTGRLNQAILRRDFEKGLQLIPSTRRRIKRYRTKLDDHKILVFYFKFAWIFFGAGNIDRAIHYLNKIINKDLKNLRLDIQIYARLMFLMCHYELRNYDTLIYLLRSFQPFFYKAKKDTPLQLLTLQLFKKLAKKPESEHKGIMKNYIEVIEDLQEDASQRIAFSYLDVLYWLKNRVR